MVNAVGRSRTRTRARTRSPRVPYSRLQLAGWALPKLSLLLSPCETLSTGRCWPQGVPPKTPNEVAKDLPGAESARACVRLCVLSVLTVSVCLCVCV